MLDARDGPATNEPWITSLQWPGNAGFLSAPRQLWRLPCNEAEAYPDIARNISALSPTAMPSPGQGNRSIWESTCIRSQEVGPPMVESPSVSSELQTAAPLPSGFGLVESGGGYPAAGVLDVGGSSCFQGTSGRLRDQDRDGKIFLPGDVVAYWRTYETLSHVVIRNAGHMAPHDQPCAMRAIIEAWVGENFASD